MTYRNADNRVKQHAKKTYYAELVVKHQNNAKELWKIINEVSHKDNDKSSIINLLVQNGTKIEDPKKIGSAFNEHFTTAGQKVVSTLPKDKKKLRKNIKLSQNLKINSVPQPMLMRLKLLN